MVLVHLCGGMADLEHDCLIRPPRRLHLEPTRWSMGWGEARVARGARKSTLDRTAPTGAGHHVLAVTCGGSTSNVGCWD